MKTQNTPFKQIAKLGLLLLLTVAIVACAAYIPKPNTSMSWKEEVLLHDGSKIISHRFYNLYGGYDTQQGAVIDETVTFNLPNGKRIVWKSNYSDSVAEPNGLSHFYFDIINGVPYLATYPAGCIAYNKWDRPNPPQVLFKYMDNQWQRITLAELPSELINAQANVIVGNPDRSLLKPFYDVTAVNAENAPISTPEYKTILGEPVKGGGGVTSCEVIVRYKCGWGGPGEFNRKYFERVCK